MKPAFALLCLITVSSLACAQPRRAIIVVDGLTVSDLQNPQRPALFDLARHGSVGLMNAAVPGPRIDASQILTMAHGIRLAAEPTDGDAYDEETESVVGERDTAGVVYLRRTGTKAPTGSVVHVGIAPLVRRGLAGPPVWGQFICGNADTDKPDRSAALFAIDSAGIAHGSVGSAILGQDSEWPFRVHDDPYKIATRVLNQSEVNVVIRLGDGARLEAVRPRWTDYDYTVWRKGMVLEGVERLISLLRPRLDDILLICVRPARSEWNHLLPVVWFRAGRPPGLLTSATTRTAGIITNVDIGATAIQLNGRSRPAGLEGHPIESVPTDSAFDRIDQLDRTIANTDRAQLPIFWILAIVGFPILFGGLAYLVLTTRPDNIALNGAATVPYASRVFQFGILFLMNMPLAMMLAVPFAASEEAVLIASTLGIMLVCAGMQRALARFVHAIDPPTAAMLMAAVVILLDGAAGQHLIKYSVFSAYMVQGFRFYGIGNEYIGILIGAVVLVAFTLKMRRAPAIVAFAVTAFILGWPGLGANAGGLIGAVVAFGSAALILLGRKVSWISALILSLLGVGFAVGFAFAERLFSVESHFGGAISDAGSRGLGYLAAIAARKIVMNVGLLVKPYSLIGMAAAIGLTWVCQYRLSERTRLIFQIHPGWALGLPAVGWGALAAFAFNDSGIVAALFIVGTFMIAGIYYLFDAEAVTQGVETEACST